MNKNKKLFSTLVRIYLGIISLTIIFPILWILYTSFKTNQEFFQNVWLLPKTLHFDNYLRAWKDASIGRYFLNSSLITSVVVIAVAVLGSMTTYACTRLGFRIGNSIITFFMFGLFIPTIMCVVTIYILMKKTGLTNSLSGLIVLYTAERLPFTIFVMSGFYKALPKELEEAAYIDGCSYFQTFLKVILPLTKPALATISIFTFEGVWNEYVVATVLIYSDQKNTLSVGIDMFQQEMKYMADWSALMASVMIVIIPTLIIYMIFQKYITSGMTAGALKG